MDVQPKYKYQGFLEVVLPKQNEDKINKILAETLTVLSRKGYESTTINDVSETAGVSRGLLHYYFKDKEEMIAKALTFGFSPMWDASVGTLSNSRSAAELVDKMIEILKTNVEKNPDFTALLFEMWVSGRRSEKIRKVFLDGLNEAINRLTKLLEFASSLGIIKINSGESEGMIRVLFAMYYGLAIQLLTDPEKVKDKKICMPIRRMLMSAFEGDTSSKGLAKKDGK
jgi:AcrR family transcriptional regulator